MCVPSAEGDAGFKRVEHLECHRCAGVGVFQRAERSVQRYLNRVLSVAVDHFPVADVGDSECLVGFEAFRDARCGHIGKVGFFPKEFHGVAHAFARQAAYAGILRHDDFNACAVAFIVGAVLIERTVDFGGVQADFLVEDSGRVGERERQGGAYGDVLACGGAAKFAVLVEFHFVAAAAQSLVARVAELEGEGALFAHLNLFGCGERACLQVVVDGLGNGKVVERGDVRRAFNRDAREGDAHELRVLIGREVGCEAVPALGVLIERDEFELLVVAVLNADFDAHLVGLAREVNPARELRLAHLRDVDFGGDDAARNAEFACAESNHAAVAVLRAGLRRRTVARCPAGFADFADGHFWQPRRIGHVHAGETFRERCFIGCAGNGNHRLPHVAAAARVVEGIHRVALVSLSARDVELVAEGRLARAVLIGGVAYGYFIEQAGGVDVTAVLTRFGRVPREHHGARVAKVFRCFEVAHGARRVEADVLALRVEVARHAAGDAIYFICMRVLAHALRVAHADGLPRRNVGDAGYFRAVALNHAAVETGERAAVDGF